MSMAKDKSTGEYLWATEIWHHRLLKYDERPGGLSRFFLGGGPSSDVDDACTTITSSESIDDKSDRSDMEGCG
jgi:hypothetical protein